MSGGSRAVLWDIRDDRTLSAFAKLAYLMLWSRGAEVYPAMKTLAADMGVSLSSAHRSVRELQAAGLLKVVPRHTGAGGSDSNQFELAAPGSCHTDTPSCLMGTGGRVTQTPKDRTLKDESEGRKSRASRRARPAVTRDEMIALVQRAVMLSYDEGEYADVTDGQYVALWYQLIGNRHPRDPVSYLMKIFTETPYLDTHLANAGTEEDWLLAAGVFPRLPDDLIGPRLADAEPLGEAAE